MIFYVLWQLSSLAFAKTIDKTYNLLYKYLPSKSVSKLKADN